MTNQQPVNAPYVAAPQGKPPLGSTRRRAALTAGGIGFGLVGLGYAAVNYAISLLMQLAVAVALRSSAGLFLDEDTSEWDLVGLFSDLPGITEQNLWIVASLLTAGGIIVSVIGIVVSGIILKRRSVARPWGVTWSGVGIGTALYLVVTFTAGSVIGILLGLSGDEEIMDPMWMLIVSTGVQVLLCVIVGMFTWWWMAHALRSRV